MRKTCYYILSVLIVVLFTGCVDELDIIAEVDEDFESLLVVEATITDELKKQVILLSRAYGLDDAGPIATTNAQLTVSDENGNIYGFDETVSGTYESISPFAAQPDVAYELEITTSNGIHYRSSMKSFTDRSQIDELFVERNFNENEVEGVSIYVNSMDPMNSVLNYRYTYEETYKIIAPFYVSQDLNYSYIVEILPDGTPISIVTYYLADKEDEQQVCYNTVASNEIIIRNTANFIEGADNDRFRVRFINRENYILSHRYSILVKQFTQSLEAYNYYKVLKELSGAESLLSESQPGYVRGNIESVSDPDELVVGFFEVASVDTKRVYFNYSDLFPGELLPQWIDDCDIFAPPDGYEGVVPPNGRLIDALDQGNKYFQPNLDPVPISPLLVEGAYDLVPAICGDCRVLGNNYPPEFWIDD